MTSVLCPVCGSDKVQTVETTESRQLTLGPVFQYALPMHKCDVCGEEGDFNGSSDPVREDHLQKAREHLAIQLIDEIAAAGLKIAYIERAFELPQRTISSKWRTGKISAPGLALLRVIRTMPWIVHVADQKFSAGSIAKAIATEFQNFVKQNGGEFTGSETQGNTNKLQIHITKVTANENAKAKVIGIHEYAPLASGG